MNRLQHRNAQIIKSATGRLPLKPLALLMLLGLAACQSIPQAALVYSSRIAIGADVNTGGTDAQGPSLTIGYKSTDLAYVPVAVQGASGVTTGHGIVPLLGNHGENLPGDAFARLPDKERGLIEDYVQQRQVLAKLQNDLNAQTKQLQGQMQLAASAASGTPAADTDKLTATVARTKDAVAKQQSAVDLALKAAMPAFNQFSQLSQTRSDALSVFGSFNGTTNASGGASSVGAGLTAGRLFSTGVAAQQLASAAAADSQTRCILAVQAVAAATGASGTELTDLAGKGLVACQAKAGN
jgi:hypothetical protein